jgi:AcrR family transcriptional regulator
VAQVKKTEVKQAIVASAFRRFADRGYAHTSLAQIARDAGISTSNIYVYFGSKLEILLAIFRPWLLVKIDELEMEIDGIDDSRQRLRRIFQVLWDEIPAADRAFAVNLMQGLILAGPKDRYSRDLLRYLEARISAMLAKCLPADRLSLLDQDAFAHLCFMAFDGFIANQRIHGRSRRIDAIVDLAATLLLGEWPDEQGRTGPVADSSADRDGADGRQTAEEPRPDPPVSAGASTSRRG